MKKILLLSTVMALALLRPSYAATPFSEAQVQSIQNILKEYIKSNPEIVGKALHELQIRQQQTIAENSRRTVEKYTTDIFGYKGDKILGNANGDKQMVMFVDPYCGYCRQFWKEVDKTINAMPNLKVNVKYFPLWGEQSLTAIKGLMAADMQGQYDQMQEFLFKQREPLSPDQLKDNIKTMKGIDPKKFSDDFSSPIIEANFQQNFKLGQTLGIQATPTVVINDQIIQGVIPAAEMQKLINAPKSNPALTPMPAVSTSGEEDKPSDKEAGEPVAGNASSKEQPIKAQKKSNPKTSNGKKVKPSQAATKAQ